MTPSGSAEPRRATISDWFRFTGCPSDCMENCAGNGNGVGLLHRQLGTRVVRPIIRTRDWAKICASLLCPLRLPTMGSLDRLSG